MKLSKIENKTFKVKKYMHVTEDPIGPNLNLF